MIQMINSVITMCKQVAQWLGIAAGMVLGSIWKDIKRNEAVRRCGAVPVMRVSQALA